MNESTNDQSLSAKVSTWHGRPVTDLGHQELLDCIEYLGQENTQLRQKNALLTRENISLLVGSSGERLAYAKKEITEEEMTLWQSHFAAVKRKST
jgi:hypothetical protein